MIYYVNRSKIPKISNIYKNTFFFRKQQEKELGLDSDDDSEREESSKTTSKTFPRRSLAIQSGHKVNKIYILFKYH